MHFINSNTKSVYFHMIDFVCFSFLRGGGGYSGKYGFSIIHK